MVLLITPKRTNKPLKLTIPTTKRLTRIICSPPVGNFKSNYEIDQDFTIFQDRKKAQNI
jgi:hypothetical protein